MSDRRILSVCVPNYRSVLLTPAHVSISQLCEYLGSIGQPFSQHYEPSSVADMARQQLVDGALADETVTDVLFLDDDMVFTPQHFADLWNEYREHDLDYLAALAFRNSTPTCPCVFGKVPGMPRWSEKPWWHIMSDYPGLPRRQFNPKTQGYDVVLPNGPHGRFKCEATGMGMVLMSRRMLDAMRRDADGNIDPGYRHFKCKKAGYPNDDIAFCLNAIDKGFDIWCDSRVSIGHISKDAPIIGERQYINEGDMVEQCATPIPQRLKPQGMDTTETMAVPPMEAVAVNGR